MTVKPAAATVRMVSLTPLRPMTLEAMAGKSPVTHVGKLYNAPATRIAHAIVASVPGITDAQSQLVSQSCASAVQRG